MAFCAVSEQNVRDINFAIKTKILENPSNLKDMRKFTQSMFNFLTGKNVPVEKAITLLKYLPQTISGFLLDRVNRDLLKAQGVTVVVSDFEDQFDTYETLAKYIGLKNEVTPLSVVTEAQLTVAQQISKLMTDNTVEIKDKVRYINNVKYENRVTSIAKVGYIDKDEEDIETPALKHGNTVDAIAKSVFQDEAIDFKDYKDKMDEVAFEGLVAKLRAIRNKMLLEGYLFRAGVTVFDPALKISGEIDLIAINPKGEVLIMDFKTANQRFNEPYLKNDTLTFKSDEVIHQLGILSKWNQYATQGYIYANLLKDQLGVPFVNKIGIIGINISYDPSVPVETSKITKTVDVIIHNIPYSDVRSQYKGKGIKDIFNEYKNLENKYLGSVTEVTPSAPVRVRKKIDRPPISPLDRVAVIDEIAATDAELKVEIDWLKSRFGKETLIQFDNMVNAGILGQWTLKGITLFKNASKGTAYHEGWHQFSQVMLTREQKRDLYESVQKDGISYKTRDGRKINTANASFLDVEEFLAEQFAKFALSPSTYKYPTKNDKPRNIFQRIWDALLRFFGSKNRPIHLFHKLYTGRTNQYIPSINNAFWGKLNSIVESLEGEEIISNERFPLYVESLEALINDELKKFNRSFTSLKESKDLQRKVFGRVYDILHERYETDDSLTDEQFYEIEKIIQNKFAFTKAFLKATAFDTIKDLVLEEKVFAPISDNEASLDDLEKKYVDEMEENDVEDDDSKPERFDRTGNEDSALSLLDSAMTDFFRSIPKIKEVRRDSDGKETLIFDTNELGYRRHHKYYDIYNKTKKLLSGAFDINEMIARMENKNNQRRFPELKLILDGIRPFIENSNEKNPERMVQNAMFVQAFALNMSMPEVPNMQLTVDFRDKHYKLLSGTKVTFKTASRNLILKIIKSWEKMFRDARNKEYINFNTYESQKGAVLTTPIYLTEDGKMLLNPFVDYANEFKNTEKDMKIFFELMGIELNPKVFEDPDAVSELRTFKAKLTRNIEIYKKYKQEEFFFEAEKILAEEGVDLDTLVDEQSYFNALPNYYFDELAKTFFINNSIAFFNEKRVYEKSSSKELKDPESQKSTEAMRFAFEDVAGLEEMYGERVSSGAFRIEDKTKYPYYIPNQLLITTVMLNKVMHISEFANNPYLAHLDPIANPWLLRSFFYKRMFDQNGDRIRDDKGKPIEIKVQDIASVRFWQEEGIIEKHPRSLTEREKFFTDILTLFKGGSIEVSRAETSSTIFTVQLSNYGISRVDRTPKVLPFTVDETANGIPETFHQIVKDYFLAEIEKRQWFIKNEPDNKFAGRFNIFQDILPAELRQRVESHLDKEADVIFEQEDIHKDFRKAIETYFNQRINDIKKKFDALPESQKVVVRDTAATPNTKSLASIARAFILNRFVLNQEFYQMYFGDLYYYKNPFKRGKFVTNTGNPFYIDQYRNETLNRLQFNTMHSMLTGTAPGGKDFSKISTAIINDVEMKSSYVGEDDSENMILNDIVNMRVASGSLVKGSPEYISFIEKTRSALGYNSDPTKRKGYYKINIADGQGIIGLDFYRNFSIITNIWGEEKELEYKRQLAIFRKHFNLYFVQGTNIPLEGEALVTAKASDNELIEEGPHAYFNPLKISYTGPQIKAGPMRPVFDKFSVRPIIPEAAIGRRDESLLREMAFKDLDYVKFQSGSKVYHDATFDWFKKVGDGVYDLGDFNVDEIEPNFLMAAYLKHQLSTEGMKESNILGSQFRKIVFGIKYSPLVKNNPALVAHFEGLERRFFDSVTELLELEQDGLFSLLGIQRSGTRYRVADMKKFLDLLVEESVKRGVAINNIDYIQYNEQTKNATHPIDYAFNRQQIQDLLSGLIDERLRRLKVNGSSLIQVSSAGYEQKVRLRKASDELIRKFGTTGLHFYHIEYDRNGTPLRTSTMGVKVGFTREYEKLLDLPAPESLGVKEESFTMSGISRSGRLISAIYKKGKFSRAKPIYKAGQIGTLERLNKALKDPEWKKQYMSELTLIGYRIPTQNNNFIDHMEIMEFLPASVGAVIIPPIELIVKSGSDFDIDKMNVIRPNINPNGRLVDFPKEDIKTINSEISKLIFDERERSEYKKDLGKLIAGTKDEIERVQALQRKIHMTIIDLTYQLSVNDSIIDEIVQNINNNEDVIIPEAVIPFKGPQPASEDSVFSEEQEWDDKVEKLMEAIDDFWAQSKRIDAYLENIEGYKAERSSIDRNDLKWFSRKKDYKRAVHNKMFSTLTETLSHPYYFELLVTPSSTKNFDSLTNQLLASQANMTPEQLAAIVANENLFDRSKTPEENSRYEASAEAFENLLSRRKDLGGYAIQRTFADLFNHIKFTIAKNYTVTLGKNSVTKTIFTPLIAPSDRDKVVKNGRILMHGDATDGVPIKDSFDELISLTVDLANSPAYPKMGISNYNKKYVQYLLHQKVPAKQVLWFINQPILKELFDLYEQNRLSIVGYTLKHAIVDLSLKKKILKNPVKNPDKSKAKKYQLYEKKWIPPRYEPGTDIKVEGTGMLQEVRGRAYSYLARPFYDLSEQNLDETVHFSFEKMDAAIRGEKDKELQGQILAYFGSITEEADALMQVEFANNVDTTKYATLTSLIRNRENRRKIYLSDLFDRNEIQKLEKQTMIAPFDYTLKAYEIYKALFPKLYTDRTITSFTNLVNDIFGVKNVEIERLSKIIENDYIEYIYKNYGEYKGQNLSEAFENQVINLDGTSDHFFFTDRFLTTVAKYPELRDVPFVNGLYEDAYFPPFLPIENSYSDLDNMEVRNLFFLRNPDNPTYEKNLFTGNWRNLINFSPEKLGLKQNYTTEQVKEISELFLDMVYFSLYQSGLTNTGNGFSDLIPYEYWAEFVEDAFNRYEGAKERNIKLENSMMDLFEIRFRQMNPKVNWRTKTEVSDEKDENGEYIKKDIPFYKNYFRGKDYLVTPDDIRISEDKHLFSDEEVEDNTDINLPEKKQSKPVSLFEPGRYVVYSGETYMIVRSVKEGMWEIYNPRKTGIGSRLTVREKNLQALNEKGTIVEYNGKRYIVTAKEEIIDLSDFQRKSWSSTDKNRVAVLKLAKDKNNGIKGTGQVGPDGLPPIDVC